MNLVRCFASLAWLAGSCSGQAPRDIAKTAFRSVVLIATTDSTGQPLSLGSGFFVRAGVVATNAHVIKDAFGGTVKLVGDSRAARISDILAVDYHADLALLKVDLSAPSLPLAGITSPAVGDPVYVLGNPLGLEGTFSEGIVSGIRKTGADSILQMTAPISPGSSGGPVMDESGLVIGISVATFTEGQNLNLAVPVGYLSQLLSHPTNPTIPLGQTKNDRPIEKSIVDAIGTRSEDGVVATAFEDRGDHCYTFRVSNKLPSTISHVKVYVLFYDKSGTMFDFDDDELKDAIPAGLTKATGKCGDYDTLEHIPDRYIA